MWARMASAVTLLRMILSPGDQRQSAPGIALVIIDVDAQHIVGGVGLCELDPLVQGDLFIDLPSHVHLDIVIMLQQVVPAVLGDLQAQNRFGDHDAVVFLLCAAVGTAVARVQDDDHILFLRRHRHRKGQGKSQQ